MGCLGFPLGAILVWLFLVSTRLVLVKVLKAISKDIGQVILSERLFVSPETKLDQVLN